MSSTTMNMGGMLKIYLDNVLKGTASDQLELEVKFGTQGGTITRIDYDNVINKLLAAGFVSQGNQYLLRIQNEYTDSKTALPKMSNIRTELKSIQTVQKYCQTNSITNLAGTASTSFVKKQPFRDNKQAIIAPVNATDFNFRVSLASETTLDKNSKQLINTVIAGWDNQKKVFRYMNRYTLKHPEMPFNVDVSIVKESVRHGSYLTPTYTIQEAGVFNNTEKYEIEIECINSLVGTGTPFSTPELLQTAVRTAIKLVMSGLQQTNYPVGYPEQTAVQQAYLELVLPPHTYKPGMNIKPGDFIGPGSVPLQTDNIESGSKVLRSIRQNYTVTDKADGDRKLLYVNAFGKIYLINMNMQVQFTGVITKNKQLFNTILDGEHILRDKNGKFINVYAAFDVYFVNMVNFRSHAFYPPEIPTTLHLAHKDTAKDKDYRFNIMTAVLENLKIESIVPGGHSTIRLEAKTFYASSETRNIFQCSGIILQKIADKIFEYETDGLVFTPANMAVGANKPGEIANPYKTTWAHSFKWKTAADTTIDFLISVKKTVSGVDFIGNIFQDGTNTRSGNQVNQYKTVVLRVGFNDEKHGYVPVQFFPTNPVDKAAGLCNILLSEGGTENKVMFTEENEVIEDDTIVEFRYDITREVGWRWIPKKVRYDKTADYHAGFKNFGNAYHVANSNWRLIHNPITREMISTGTDAQPSDIYYNRIEGVSGKYTKAMRNFHNLFVKKLLITSVAHRGDTLTDLAVGKAGDMPKWMAAQLKFVLGIDISKDNIENRLDGAIARYATYKKKRVEVPVAVFLNGNSSINIRSTSALYADKDKEKMLALIGKGPKNEKMLGAEVFNHYGIAAEGFNICSIQFAIHYMFETQETLQNFLRNVSEMTKVGGYFIGTSYDGEEIFKLLKNKELGESEIIIEDGTKVWEVIKRYAHSDFPDNRSCVNYAIDVYQESINKTFTEYLVNYDYLTRLLENYGFVLLTRPEFTELNLPASTGLFSDLFNRMTEEIKRNPRAAAEFGEAATMTAAERRVSFLNRYFVYKKVRNVDADTVSLNLLRKTTDQDLDIVDEAKQVQELVVKTTAVENVPAVTAATATKKGPGPGPGPAKKLKKKIVLREKIILGGR